MSTCIHQKIKSQPKKHEKKKRNKPNWRKIANSKKKLNASVKNLQSRQKMKSRKPKINQKGKIKLMKISQQEENKKLTRKSKRKRNVKETGMNILGGKGNSSNKNSTKRQLIARLRAQLLLLQLQNHLLTLIMARSMRQIIWDCNSKTSRNHSKVTYCK